MELKDLRNQIDEIDDELVHLFTKRMAISAQVADYKKANNMPIHVPARERQILQEVATKAGPDMENYVRVLYSMIFELSRSYQSKRNTGANQLYQIAGLDALGNRILAANSQECDLLANDTGKNRHNTGFLIPQ